MEALRQKKRNKKNEIEYGEEEAGVVDKCTKNIPESFVGMNGELKMEK